jgi:formaldehyde-activating enzyme involved in methanogenesis
VDATEEAEPTAPVEPEPVATVEPVPDTTPEATPLPATSLNPQVQTIELPEALQLVGVIQLAAAAEAIMNVGADMTEEEREESQIIAVAAIIVSQIAGSIRRITK